MKKYRVGQIVNTHGLRGDMKIYSYTDYPERFGEIDYVFIDEEEEKFFVEKVKYHKSTPIIKLKGIDSIEDADHLRGKTLYIDESNLRELEDDEYMIADLVGMQAYLQDGTVLGEVVNVLQYTANDIYVVRTENGKEYLIPAVRELVPTIDVKEKKMIIKQIEGLLD